LAENEAKMKTSHCLGDRDAMMRSAAMSLYRTDADTGLETAQKKTERGESASSSISTNTSITLLPGL
jgi:hypothetical protein